MSADGEETTTVEMLPWLENWWRQSNGNPLYAWEALARCLAPDAPPDQPLPEWVREYFRAAAVNMVLLSTGRDFRREDKARIAPKQAAKLVNEALGLGRQKSKSAFDRRADDGQRARAALDATFYSDAQAKEDLAAKRSITRDRAARLIAAGKKLNRPAK